MAKVSATKNSQGANPYVLDSMYGKMLTSQNQANEKPYAACAPYESVPTEMQGDKRNVQAGP